MLTMPDDPQPSLTLVLPAYNEAERLGSALDELFGYLARGGEARAGGRSASELGPWEVLLVDDGSEDATVAVAEARPEAQPGANGETPRLRVLRRPHGGKGAAVRAGILAATSDLVAFADSDMATPPDQLPLLTSALRDHDVALGSRIQPDGTDRRSSQPFHRRALGKVFHALAGAWVTGPVPDSQCGFKGFRREAGQDLFARQRITSIVFDAEIIYLSRKRGYRVAVVPVQWADQRGSRMRVRPRLAVQVAWDLLRIPIIHRGVRPAGSMRAGGVAPAVGDPAPGAGPDSGA
jgi:glycosyltransferase involved in cell wall biosynthesis